MRVDLEDLLGAALQGDSVTIHQRLDSLVLHSNNGTIDVLGFRERPEFAQTVFLYDELPADYPEAVSNAELDREMRPRPTPEKVRYLGTSSLAGGAKALRVQLAASLDDLPLPLAGEWTLYRAGESQPFARGRCVRPERRAPADGRLRLMAVVSPAGATPIVGWDGIKPIEFVLEPMAAEKGGAIAARAAAGPPGKRARRVRALARGGARELDLRPLLGRHDRRDRAAPVRRDRALSLPQLVITGSSSKSPPTRRQERSSRRPCAPPAASR